MAEETSVPGALRKELTAEFIGTFLLILLGNGAVATAVSLGSIDLFSVSIVWALAIAVAAFGTAAVSGAHFNPSVTLAFATYTDFPWRKVAPYVAAQFAGAFTASAAIYMAFYKIIADFEATEKLTRGEPGSQLSAMIFGTYAPNPAEIGTDPASLALIPLPLWFLIEAMMTAILIFVIFFIIEEMNEARPMANLAPVFIGLTVAGLIIFGGPLTMTCLNPARDLGPRFFTFLAGWGEMAFPGPRGLDFLIPTIGPLAGSLVGGFVFHYLYKAGYPKPAPPGREDAELASDRET